MIYRSLAFFCMLSFYIIFFAKIFILRKKGIFRDKNSTDKITEILVKAIIIIVSFAEALSIILGRSYLPIMGKVIGVYFGIVSVFLMLLSLRGFKNLRSENAKGQGMGIPTRGIYSYSRNPAFLAFDLLFIGMALMYCNVFVIVLSLFAVIFFHVRILKEERYFKKIYGDEYSEYKNRTSRYYGFGKQNFKKVICELYLLLIIWCILYIVTLVCYAGIFLSWIWIWILIGVCAFIRFMMLKRDIDGVSKHKIPMPVRIIYYTLYGISLVSFIFIECNVFAAMNAYPEKNLEYVIVLGAGVNGTTPSIPLVKRIEEAYNYMSDNPDTLLIASGGQGFNESISEAECIKRELVKYGISEDRILLEDKSTSTIENLRFSMDIIKNPDANVGIITNSFHEYRAGIIAKHEGYTNAHSVPAKTLFPVGIHYMLREYFGVVRLLMELISS